MELKIIIRQSWKLLICTFFLAAALLAASLFFMQYILDGISMGYTLETYASVGTIYQANNENAAFSPVPEEAIALLREADTVQGVDIRRTVSARIPGTESVPCYFAIAQANHLAFFRGIVKDYTEFPEEERVESAFPYEARFATVEVESVYAGKSNWITAGQNVIMQILCMGQGSEVSLELDEEYYFITQSSFSSQLGWLWDEVRANNFTDEVLAEYEEYQSYQQLCQHTVIPVPEDMSGDAADAYAAGLLKERGLDAYTDEIKNLDDVFTVRTTQDMQMLLPVANETMFFHTGRGIRPEDAGERVCVISWELAKLHDFQVGDHIPLALGNGCYDENGYESGYPSVGGFSTVSYGEPQEYEIIGTYAFAAYDAAESTLLFSYNDIFVPPNEQMEAEANKVSPYAFSFRVDGDRYDDFMNSTAMELADLGYVVQMSSSRWEEVESTYHSMLQRRTLTLVWAVLAFVLGTVVYVLLLIFLYRREYAVRNLFGVKFSHTSRAYLTPFAASLVLAGILAVAASDWLYVKKLMPRAEATAPGRLPGNGQVLSVLMVLVLVWMIVALIIILAAAKRAERKSVLKLLK